MLYLHPLTRDAGGGDGLFAVRDIQPDTVISFYHGELIGPGQNSDNPCTGRRDIGGSVEMFLSGILIKTESEGIVTMPTDDSWPACHARPQTT